MLFWLFGMWRRLFSVRNIIWGGFVDTLSQIQRDTGRRRWDRSRRLLTA